MIPAFPGVNALDVTGPAEIFALAGRVPPEGRAGYEVRLIAERRGRAARPDGPEGILSGPR
ncbi:hypothetical protein [Embleya sp. NBC_00896]|uniref:hypothetical protein n=1 Tax=Embleya sp. NBC_00896 TaxID=2975961 RepID=UPI002F90A593|nr:hypothetical protein OG928_36015 [Embleya sp. NBC_00896]